MMAYFRLGYSRVKESLAGLENWPRGLDLATEALNNRKATVKIRRKSPRKKDYKLVTWEGKLVKTTWEKLCLLQNSLIGVKT